MTGDGHPQRAAQPDNVRNTLSRLLELGALPVINENDAVATDEIGVENTIGENDSLSAIVAAAIGADLLILLSDIDGLYDSDPRKNPDAHLIETVPVIDAHILSLAGGQGLRARHRRHGHEAARRADRNCGRLRDGYCQRRKARGPL